MKRKEASEAQYFAAQYFSPVLLPSIQVSQLTGVAGDQRQALMQESDGFWHMHYIHELMHTQSHSLMLLAKMGKWFGTIVRRQLRQLITPLPSLRV